MIEGRERTIQYPEFFLRPNAPVLLAYPLKDLEGRPCGEANVSEEKLAGVELNFRRCTYPGRRYGNEMNVSALKQLVTHWDEIQALSASLRSASARRHGCAPSTSVAHLWMFGRTAAALPAYLSRRAAAPFLDGEIPPVVAGMFKAMQGVFMTAELLVWKPVIDGRPMLEISGVIGAADFVKVAEEQDVFLSSPSKRVCSGPIHMVADFVQTIYDGSTGAAVPSFLAGDLDAYLTYGAANILIGLLHIIVRWRLRQQLRRVLACLRRCNGTLSEDPRLRTVVARLTAAADAITFRWIEAPQFATICDLAQFVAKTDGTVAIDPRLLGWPFTCDPTTADRASARDRLQWLEGLLPAALTAELLVEVDAYGSFVRAAVDEFNQLYGTITKALGRVSSSPLTYADLLTVLKVDVWALLGRPDAVEG